MIDDFLNEFRRYRVIGEQAMAQVGEDGLNRVLGPDANSIAMIVRHLSGNFSSRFTDFLESDGEKPWRHRDAEFEERTYTHGEVNALWESGWEVALREVAALTDGQLQETVHIRGTALTVHEALCRSVAHTAYHVGQIVLLARLLSTEEWRWISIPKGQSESYNRNPTLEKHPR